MAKPEQLYDKRLYERFLRRGELSGKDFDAHLAGLTDTEDNAENIADIIYKADGAAEAEAPAAEAAPADAAPAEAAPAPVASDDAPAQDAPTA